MIYILHNALPILAAAFAAMCFGVVWAYLVGRWTQGGVASGSRPALSTSTVALSFACEAWIAAILAGALILAPVEAGGWTVALGSAFIIWAGFVLPVLTAAFRFRGLAWRLVLADTLRWLGAMLVMAAVLRMIGVEAP